MVYAGICRISNAVACHDRLVRIDHILIEYRMIRIHPKPVKDISLIGRTDIRAEEGLDPQLFDILL